MATKKTVPRSKPAPKPAALPRIPYVRLLRADYQNSIGQLEESYRSFLIAFDGGEPGDLLDALNLVLSATECLKSIRYTSLTHDELESEYEAERARILATAGGAS